MAQDDSSQKGRNAFDPDAFNLPTADREQLNGMILFNLDYYKEMEYQGRELWLSFAEDFQDWSVDHLKKASNHVIKRLRDYLLSHGILVNKQEEKITIAAALSRTIGWPQYRRWPVDIPAPFPGNDNLDENDADAKAAKTTVPPVMPSTVSPVMPESTVPPVMPSSLPHASTSSSAPPSTEPEGEIDFAETIRAYNSGKETSEHHALSDFGKLYDDKLQYGGKESTDSFDHKFLLWINHCHMLCVLKTTIDKIFAHAQEPPIPIVLCTDSRLLYECLVKLGTTNEKRLMIDIMALRQVYEIREIAEVRWIDGTTNPADAMTKSTACNALKAVIDTNALDLRPHGWVPRPGEWQPP